MTKSEALIMALEALEANHFLIHGSENKGGLAFCMDGYYSGCFDIDLNDKQTNRAITAIKKALAQQRTWIGLDQTTKPDIRHQTEAFFAGVQWAETRLKELNHETQ